MEGASLGHSANQSRGQTEVTLPASATAHMRDQRQRPLSQQDVQDPFRHGREGLSQLHPLSFDVGDGVHGAHEPSAQPLVRAGDALCYCLIGTVPTSDSLAEDIKRDSIRICRPSQSMQGCRICLEQGLHMRKLTASVAEMLACARRLRLVAM